MVTVSKSEEKEYKKQITLVKSILLWVFGISFVIFVIIAALAVWSEGVTKVVTSLLSVNPFYMLAAVVVVFISYLMRYPKWELYVHKLGVRISRAKNIAIYLSMYSMEITPGRWGRAVVSYTMNRLTGIKVGKTFPAVVADIFTDFFGFIIVCLAASLFLEQYVLLSLFISGLLLLQFIFLYFKGPFSLLKKYLGHIKKLGSFFTNAELYFKSNKKLSLGDYAFSLAITIPSWIINGFALYLVMLGFGVNVPIALLPEIIFVFSSSLLLGIVTGIPAALGVTDAALISYLTVFFGGIGVDFGLASLITIVFRIINIWFVEGFGFAALAYTFRYWELPPQVKKVLPAVTKVN